MAPMIVTTTHDPWDLFVSVNALSAGDERNTQIVQFVNDFQKMPRAPCQSVKSRDENNVECVFDAHPP